jgi:hypothetical protein
MLKNIVLGVLVVAAAGLYIYLNQQNSQAVADAAASRKAIAEARAHAQAMATTQAAAKSTFQAMILSDFNKCKAEAATKKNAKDREAAEAACKSTYDTRLAQGT